MPSLAEAVNFAVARKKMPLFEPGSTRDLAVRLGMQTPISIQDLIDKLNGLPPDSVTYASPRMVAGTVHGNVTIFLQSDGGMAFMGQAHESGVSGDHFLLSIALLDVKDAAGNTLVFKHED